MKRLLLLGGGHAHVQVLAELARQPLAGVEVHLVTPHARQLYSGMVPGLIAGHHRADDCMIPLAPLAARAGVQLTLAAAVGLDAQARELRLDDGRVLGHELLSIDTGPVLPLQALPGAAAHAIPVRPIEGFVTRLAVLAAAAEVRALDIVVVGGGAAGVELALALAWRHGRREAAPAGVGPCRVTLVAGPSGPLPGLGERLRRRAARALALGGVTVVPGTAVEVDAGHVHLAGGTRVACDAAVLALGAAAPAWLAASGLALDEQGFVATGATLQSVSHPHVFAAGDVATRLDAPHPKSGVYAVRAGPPLAHNLRAAALDQPLQPYRPQPRALYLLALGRRRALASWGPWSAQGRWVWAWKQRIDRRFVQACLEPGAGR